MQRDHAVWKTKAPAIPLSIRYVIAKNLIELEVKEQYQIKITNRFAALENLNDSQGINRSWKNIKENIKTSAKESLGLYKQKHHKSWFDEECSEFLDQDPNRNKVGNVNTLRS